MKNITKASTGLALLALLANGASAQTVTIDVDFSNYASGTKFTNEIAGATFSLMGGPQSNGAPVVGNFGGVLALENSVNGSYPSAAILDVQFTGTANNVFFKFDNFGSASSGRGATFFSTFDSFGTLLETGNVGNGGSFSLKSTGIADLQFNNNTGGSASWVYGLQTLHADVTAAVPEPETYALMLAGLGVLGAVARRRKAR